METIELKIDLLRSKLNSQKTYKQNNKLIEQRANENISKLRESQSRPGSANIYSSLPLEKHSGLMNSSKNQVSTKSKRMPQVSQTSRVKIQTSKSKSKKAKILKAQPGKLKEVVKDPETKKNYDSMGFRVTSLYLHNEYFHGNYSNGVQMYMSTCNNEKYFPYKTLNPIPNDPMYQKSGVSGKITSGQVLNRPSKLHKLPSKNLKVEEIVEDDLSDPERELVNSFDSNPAEVIELYSPVTEEVTPSIPQRPKSAAERQREYQLERGQRPGTVQLQEKPEDEVGQIQPTIDHEDHIKKPPRSKSRSNTFKSQKAEPMAKEDPNFFDDEF